MSVFSESIMIIREQGIFSFIKRLFRRVFSDVQSLKVWILEERDPCTRFHLVDLERGLLDSTKENTMITDNDLARIARAYRSAKRDQLAQPAEYQVTGDWAQIVREQYQELASSLERDDVPVIRKILSNFARDKVSRGLWLSGNLPDSFLDKIRMLHAINSTYTIWKKMTGLPDSVLEYPKEIGNMHGIDTGGRSVMLPAFHQSYFAMRIGSLLDGNSGKRRSIVEIGGGYGSLAYHLFSHEMPNCRYISLDIPEICVLASYFLMSNFPEKKFILYGEDGSGADCTILPNFSIKDLPDSCCDLVFNSHSMTQMNPKTVKEYMRQIDRISTTYFLHANSEISDQRYLNLNSAEYELPRAKFRRVYRFPEIIRDDGYFSPKFSTWEYLYQRCAD